MSDESRVGRLDLLAQDGLGQIAENLGRRFGLSGLRDILNPTIKRFVDENVSRTKMPVTPEAIAERLGLLSKPKKLRENR